MGLCPSVVQARASLCAGRADTANLPPWVADAHGAFSEASRGCSARTAPSTEWDHSPSTLHRPAFGALLAAVPVARSDAFA